MALRSFRLTRFTPHSQYIWDQEHGLCYIAEMEQSSSKGTSLKLICCVAVIDLFVATRS